MYVLLEFWGADVEAAYKGSYDDDDTVYFCCSVGPRDILPNI